MTGGTPERDLPAIWPKVDGPDRFEHSLFRFPLDASITPPHLCELMAINLADERVPIIYTDATREYSIPLVAGHEALQRISFCPWCGQKLPETLRDEWFERLEALGIAWDEDDLPGSYRTGEWWRNDPDLDVLP